MRSFLLVTLRRYRQQERDYRERIQELRTQIREMETARVTLEAMLREANASVLMRERDLMLATDVVKNDRIRRRAIDIVNAEISIWLVGKDGTPNPPTVHDTIAGMYEKYKGLRPRDLTDLLPGMVGIAIEPRQERSTIIIAQPKEISPDAGSTPHNGDGTST